MGPATYARWSASFDGAEKADFAVETVIDSTIWSALYATRMRIVKHGAETAGFLRGSG
jgi:hypothetical protein